MSRIAHLAATLLLLASPLAAADPKPAAAAPKSEAAAPSSPLDRIKGLAGTWTGTGGHGEQKMEMSVTYRVTGGGSAVVETLFPGTEHEMVTVYHMNGDRLELTHYCAAGNQPHMVAEPAKEPNVLSFRCAGGTNMKESDMHMHAATLTFVDADRMKGVWSSVQDGKPAGDAVFDLARKK